MRRFHVRRFSRGFAADILQDRGGLQQLPRARIRKKGAGLGATQAIEKRTSEASVAASAAKTWIGATRGGPQASQRGGLQTLAVRQGVAPNTPQAGGSQGELAIGGDARPALALQHFRPSVAGRFKVIDVEVKISVRIRGSLR